MQNKLFFTCCIILLTYSATAQEPTDPLSQQLEAAAENSETEPEDDQLLQQLQYAVANPTNVNQITEAELVSLMRLSPVQINSFLFYRNLFGPIENKYELQAIPYWDIQTIKSMLPLLSFSIDAAAEKRIRALLMSGRHQLMVRGAQVIEQAQGYIPDSLGKTKYASGNGRYYLRYSYQYKQQVYYGLSTERDAGEKWGDFTSFHLFIKRNGLLRTIAAGDFVLNIGQGLLQWQGMAFGKTSEAMSVYRQGNTLQPYRSAGEWNFHRGGAVQLSKGRITSTIFYSKRKRSGNVLMDGDGNASAFSSLSESGYHRTVSEQEGRNAIQQQAYGMVIEKGGPRLRLGIAGIRYHFNLPYEPRPAPYNLFSFRGSVGMNAGIHYSYNIRNIFLFGEYGWCKTGMAIVQGAVMSVHPKLDISFVYRHFQPGYQAISASSFSESASVSNETGFYSGIRVVPHPGWLFQAYADFFSFPWLRFRTDAPSKGSEYFLQLNWVKRHKWNIIMRFRESGKSENEEGTVFNEPVLRRSTNLRLHAERIMTRSWILSSRADRIWFNKMPSKQKGWSAYIDSRWQTGKKGISVSTRVSRFSTDGYDSRIYSYERDLLYAFSIPAFYDRGWRYYAQVQGKFGQVRLIKKVAIQWWLRWSQTIYNNRTSIGSGNDEIKGSEKSEWKCQLMFTW